MSSDLSTGALAASAEQATLTPVPDLPPMSLVEARARASRGLASRLHRPRRSPAGAAGSGPGCSPSTSPPWSRRGSSWAPSGLPGVTVGRRLAAGGAAILVTLAAMPLLGLYRSRLCVERRRETSRIAVACVTGAVTFGLVTGDALDVDDAVIVAAGSCTLALVVLRWAFGQWLSAQRARGHYRRGIVMVGTDEDAVDVWRMLHSQPELGLRREGNHRRARGLSRMGRAPQQPDHRRAPRHRDGDGVAPASWWWRTRSRRRRSGT